MYGVLIYNDFIGLLIPPDLAPNEVNFPLKGQNPVKSV